MKLGIRKSSFIRRFAGPHGGIVCFPFYQLVVAMGCPFTCSYCFLQTTPNFVFRPDELAGMVFENIGEMIAELKDWLSDATPKMIIAGELQDGLVFDPAYVKVHGVALTHMIIPLFAAQQRHQLIFLTKSVQIEYALQLPPTPQVVFSWSVNADEVADPWEHGAPAPAARLEAARRMKAAGWRVRLRLDPMVPIPAWERAYGETINRINALQPEMVTIGALRATNKNTLRTNATKNGRDATIFDCLSEKDPSGFKHRIPFEQQLAMYRFAISHLNAKTVPALCKEDTSVWQELGLPFKGCHCLLNGNDQLVHERPPSLVQLGTGGRP